MILRFLGAAHEVTGSCFYIDMAGHHILVDCGMEQGPDEYENQDIPVAASEIDAVLLTHAHIDHSGKLPLLYKRGFRGAIHATGATCDLCDIMLRDSAHIQMFEAEWRNRKAKRSGHGEFEPMYDMEDAEGAIKCFVPHSYGERFTLMEGVDVCFTDAGHLLGSASIEIWLTEDGTTKKLVFSGDIGNTNQPLIRDPQYLTSADYVVMESTYGDRNHGENEQHEEKLAEIIQQTFAEGGNVVIPSFAVGRTQELLYFLRHIKQQGLVKGFDDFPVYVDSPLAVEATHIFNKDIVGYFDEEAMELVNAGINPISFPGLHTAVSSDESRAINDDPRCKVILSASGMCEAGRIKHHLKHNLWRPESTIVFAGYQAQGTLGRSLLNGARHVRLFGEEIEVRARIERFQGISGHADQHGLLRWIQHFEQKPKAVFIVHGNDEVCTSFAELVQQTIHRPTAAPYNGAAYDLLTDTWIDEGNKQKKKAAEKARDPRATAAFERLLTASQRLQEVIRHNRDGANKDLARLTDQINALCEKWDR